MRYLVLDHMSQDLLLRLKIIALTATPISSRLKGLDVDSYWSWSILILILLWWESHKLILQRPKRGLFCKQRPWFNNLECTYWLGCVPYQPEQERDHCVLSCNLTRPLQLWYQCVAKHIKQCLRHAVKSETMNLEFALVIFHRFSPERLQDQGNAWKYNLPMYLPIDLTAITTTDIHIFFYQQQADRGFASLYSHSQVGVVDSDCT